MLTSASHLSKGDTGQLKRQSPKLQAVMRWARRHVQAVLSVARDPSPPQAPLGSVSLKGRRWRGTGFRTVSHKDQHLGDNQSHGLCQLPGAWGLATPQPGLGTVEGPQSLVAGWPSLPWPTRQRPLGQASLSPRVDFVHQEM